jgi:hypothetical protein
MGQARRNKQFGIKDKVIRKREYFIALCIKYTRYSYKEILRFMQIRIKEGRL